MAGGIVAHLADIKHSPLATLGQNGNKILLASWPGQADYVGRQFVLLFVLSLNCFWHKYYD